jgi:hypothetical protein
VVLPPPTINILPSGSNVAVCQERGVVMSAAGVNNPAVGIMEFSRCNRCNAGWQARGAGHSQERSGKTKPALTNGALLNAAWVRSKVQHAIPARAPGVCDSCIILHGKYCWSARETAHAVAGHLPGSFCSIQIESVDASHISVYSRFPESLAGALGLSGDRVYP